MGNDGAGTTGHDGVTMEHDVDAKSGTQSGTGWSVLGDPCSVPEFQPQVISVSVS